MTPPRAKTLDWTGERCISWATDAQVVYEHYHRYLWARSLVESRRVLDLGSGEGYGAALLAERAQEVLGVDVDEASIEHSRRTYPLDNLAFELASATNLKQFSEASFDVVVAFEIIEHISDQETVLAQVARLLSPTGLLIISTPDRVAYSDQAGNANPFHERELTQSEFTGLLGGHFDTLALYGQRAVSGSHITAMVGGVGAREERVDFAISKTGEGWEEAEPPRPMYLLAIASNGPLPRVPMDSGLSDFGLVLSAELQEKVRRAEQGRHSAEAQAAEFLLEIEGLARDLEDERRRAADLRHELERVHGSVTWQLLERLRSLLYRLIGHESAAGRAFQAFLRRLGRLTR